ncbi:MAG: class I SAM-dependent methyltransferase [Flavobacteriaceae bacterium]|nr:class I SAM-dependent methyltransferase [Flavobacteriaceae bacterium]
MNNQILTPQVQAFINKNLKEDIATLVLKGSPFEEVRIQELAEQIEAKAKCEKKLPTFYQKEQIYYPNKLNIAQTSSEITANYKATLVGGTSLIDITGGFGVDAYYFSKKVQKVVHCEVTSELSVIATHNYKVLGVENIKTIAEDGISYLQNTTEQYDWIYADPSRRNDAKGKVFLLEDCLPNIPKNLSILFSKTTKILLKVSPILDISKAIEELQFVKEVRVVAVANEVKELLFILEKGYDKAINIVAVNILKNGEQQEFSFIYKSEVNTIYGEESNYLYEPNVAILKAGGMPYITSFFEVKKMAQHSHLYTSNELVDFPGRTFKIDKVIPCQKKEIKRLGIKKANITTRNFPESVAEIRKRLKIKEGGSIYLFFTKNLKNQNIICVSFK